MNKQFKVVEAGFNDRGYWEEDISSCCGAPVVYFDYDVGIFVQQYGLEKETLSKHPRCKKCDKELIQKK